MAACCGSDKELEKEKKRNGNLRKDWIRQLKVQSTATVDADCGMTQRPCAKASANSVVKLSAAFERSLIA